jgi:hypothetical protein
VVGRDGIDHNEGQADLLVPRLAKEANIPDNEARELIKLLGQPIGARS